MGRRRKNTFAKALGQLKSTKIDEKIQMLSERPTNSVMTYMTTTPSTLNPDFVSSQRGQDSALNTVEPDFTQDDPALNGRDTTGLFQEDGTPRTAMPPGDTSYILGPMAAMLYVYSSSDWTMFGYIRQSDRRFVNLGYIMQNHSTGFSGELQDWDGVNDFTGFGQLTLEQAKWFRDVQKAPGQTNDYFANGDKNYRAYYPGPPASAPDAFGRYYCIITGEPLSDPLDKVGEKEQIPGESGEPSPDDIFSAIMDRLKKGKKLSKAEEEFLDDYEKKDNKLKDLLKDIVDNAKKAAWDTINPLNKIKDLFGDYLTPPAAEYSTNIAKSILLNKPITVKQEDIPQGDIDKFVNNLAKNNGYNFNLTVSEGEPKPYSDDNFFIDKNGKVQSNIGPNGEKAFYHDGQTQPFSVPGGKLSGGYTNPLAAAGEAQVQFVYPSDGSEPYLLYTDHAYHNLQSDDPGEVPDPIKATFSAIIHGVTGKSDPNKPNSGSMSDYPSNIKGDVKTEFKVPFGKLPASLIDRAKNERDWQQKVKSGKYVDIKLNHHIPRGKLISESRKTSILKNLKNPVVIPETKQKSYKVKPKIRGLNSAIISKPVETPKEYQPKGGRDLWGQFEYNRNVRQSQEKKNETLELIGNGEQAFNYMLNDSKALNAQQLEKYWKLHPEMYSYFYNGKKFKATRKEALDGDFLVFLVDENGEKSNILQSKLNEKLAEEHDKKMLDEYNKLNPKSKEPISFEKDYMFKKAYQKLKKEVDYKDKPAKMGYPNDPPPKMVNDRHPDFGKRPGTTMFNKLDPSTAAATPKQDDPTIDAKIEKAKNNPHKDGSNWRKELEVKIKKHRQSIK